LLHKIEETLEPTNIFDLEVPPNIFPPQRQQALSSARIHQVEPILTPPLATYYTPADYRTLSILSYFHAVFAPRGGEAVAWSVDLPLCAKAPWEVDCKEAIDAIILTGAGYEDVIPSELHNAINCGIVGLVCEEDPMVDLTTIFQNALQVWPYTQGGSVPSPTTSHCIGLALIRGVGPKNGCLHILTPVPPSLLGRYRILVKGELEMPVWGMIDFRQGQDGGVAGVKWEKVPYLRMAAGGPTVMGGVRRRVRMKLKRRGQL
jgi:polynucleotide 5'-hydroxyl-kinase GRC3/NOL9